MNDNEFLVQVALGNVPSNRTFADFAFTLRDVYRLKFGVDWCFRTKYGKNFIYCDDIFVGCIKDVLNDHRLTATVSG